MKKLFFLGMLFLGMATTANAQEEGTQRATNFRRPSLYTIMLPTKNENLQQYSSIIDSTFEKMPTPDKYNDHVVGGRIITNINEIMAESDITPINEALGNVDKAYSAALLKWLNDNHIANKMIFKWYDGKMEGDAPFFGFNTIFERGLLSASKEQMDEAQEMESVEQTIKDNASLDLIPRTFVAINRYKFMSIEEVLAITRALTVEIVPDGMAKTIAEATFALTQKALKGYFVGTTTYLYQLKWDAEIQKKFETEVYGATDVATVESFLNDDSYVMEYVGKSNARVPACMKLTLNEDKIAAMIARATERVQDKALANLARDFDDFKTLSVLHVSGKDLFSYIGAREGLKAGDKFNVLEAVVNKKTGNVDEKSIGTIKVKKGMIYDNRAKLNSNITLEDGDEAVDKDKVDANSALTATYFEGKGDFFDGMLIRQVGKSKAKK